MISIPSFLVKGWIEMMTRSKVRKLVAATLVAMAAARACPNGQTASCDDFVDQLMRLNRAEFCGNTPGMDVESVLTRNNLTARDAGLILCDKVDKILQMPLPRPAETNAICSFVLLAMSRFNVPEAAMPARSAFLDSSDSFDYEALSAFFDCVTNVQDVVNCTDAVWTNHSSRAETKRLNYSVALLKWVNGKPELSAIERNALYTKCACCVEQELSFPVAVRIDKVLLELNGGYCSSSIRTNLVNRFKFDSSARRDSRYFRRLADEMGL